MNRGKVVMNEDLLPFDFYQEVRVRRAESSKMQFINRTGVILGRTPTDDGKTWYYAVELYGESEGWCFLHDELDATGRRFNQEDFKDGSRVRVFVDENGRGQIAENS